MARLVAAVFAVSAMLLLSACPLEQLIRPKTGDTTAPMKVTKVVKEPHYVMVESASEADKLLLYYEHVQALSEKEFRQELEAVRQTAGDGASGPQILRLAMLLAQPGTPHHDADGAIELVERFEKQRTDSDEDRVLGSLSVLVRQMMEQEATLLKTKQKLASRLDEREKELEHVKSQINALKSIEKSIHERDTKEGNGER